MRRPAIVKETPAAPNTGKAALERFRFEPLFACLIEEPPCASSMRPNPQERRRPAPGSYVGIATERFDQGGRGSYIRNIALRRFPSPAVPLLRGSSIVTDL